MSKGLSLSISQVVIIIMMAFIVFFVFRIGDSAAKMNDSMGSKTIIITHCKEWQDNRCTMESAELMDIEVGDEYKTLAVLCSLEYAGDETSWSSEIYEQCRGLCLGCPLTGE